MPPETSSPLATGRERHRERWILALLLLLGGLLRTAYLLEIAPDPDFDAPHFESQYHDYWGRALITGDWTPPAGITDPEIPSTPYFRPPGYPYFLALAYRLLGPSYWTPRLVQLFLGLASCLLIWALTRRLFGPASALGALALSAVYWVFLFFEGELMAPTLLIFLLLASLLAACRWREGFSPGKAMLTGFLVGLTALVRPNALLLPACFLLWIFWVARRRRWPMGRRLFLPALLFLLTTALTIAPATWRNWRVGGDRVLLTSNAGINLFVGSHPESDGIRPGIAAMAELTRTTGWESFDYPLIVAGVERKVGRSMRHSEVSSYFTQRAMAEMRSDPSYLLSLTWRKLALFWGPAEVSNNKVIEVERENSTILKLSPSFADILALALLGGVWLLLCPGAGLATAERDTAEDSAAEDSVVEDSAAEDSAAEQHQARSRTWEQAALLLLFLLTYTASYLPFFAAARFRLPLVPILMVFAGAALARLGSLLRSGRYRSLAWGLIILAMLRAGSGFAWVPYEPNRPLWHFRRALSHQQKGQVQAALAEARQTLNLAPTYPQASLLLADLLNQNGRLEESADAYRTALLADPGSAVARGNLATTLMRSGKPRQAIEQWEEALRQQPDRLTTLNNLALALATLQDPELRDPERAVRLSEEANRLTHFDNPSLRRTLEIAYLAAGREDDARRIRERAASS